MHAKTQLNKEVEEKNKRANCWDSIHYSYKFHIQKEI